MNPKVTNTDCNYFNEHLTSRDHPARKRRPCHCEWFIETLSQISLPMDTGAGRVIAIHPPIHKFCRYSISFKGSGAGTDRTNCYRHWQWEGGDFSQSLWMWHLIWRTNLIQAFTRTSSPSVFCMWHWLPPLNKRFLTFQTPGGTRTTTSSRSRSLSSHSPTLQDPGLNLTFLFVEIFPLITNCLVSPAAFSPSCHFKK